ncbi:MAG: hypothetical protein A3B38_02880 [Candidatus Levybacteria bacterium RIFCSPLOWO2_01_FULL_36_13]|nr:MAG: hypothetical protein A2684_03970 [Candidatus Levybacteria bacterium RIFCSPHIGHO2_01_FULL_36_15b]OGH35837.1 MAG: hypothetical protein A3B38_02880 [Candidatus Levybacteria bacterium RIFCSPLOWO2_01_FULL_36_13]
MDTEYKFGASFGGWLLQSSAKEALGANPTKIRKKVRIKPKAASFNFMPLIRIWSFSQFFSSGKLI